MTTIVVTGARGFIGRNFIAAALRRPNLRIVPIDTDTNLDETLPMLADCAAVVHLAGCNRPTDEQEFVRTNVNFTELVAETAAKASRPPVFVFSSSTQALLDNPYGQSKRDAEAVLRSYAERTGALVSTFRLPGVFGKWSRPNYNSVVATFCHNIARGLPVAVHDPTKEINLVYVDDVVRQFLECVDSPVNGLVEVKPVYRTTVGAIKDTIEGFREIRSSLRLPDMSSEFQRKLYATYISYLPTDAFAYTLPIRSDHRGSLAEVLKSPGFGQIFVSRTEPGKIRGNHYHDTKVEKFCVIEGDALITFRHIESEEILQYRVRGSEYRVVDIPPGYTHAIENVGDREMIVLFWADEVFDPGRPDTYACEVSRG